MAAPTPHWNFIPKAPAPFPVINPILMAPLTTIVNTVLPKTTKAKHPVVVNKPISPIKRKRNVELALCPKCGGPNLLAFSDVKTKRWDKNADITITMKCTSCSMKNLLKQKVYQYYTMRLLRI